MIETGGINMPILTVGKMVDILIQAYTALIAGGTSPKMMPSVMLWGPPGVGKSQGVRQIARGLEEKTGKKVAVTDVRLLLFNPIDLRGIPTANSDKTLAIWLKPQIFQMDPSEDLINILFLDEISAAQQSVQAAAYQITLDRVVGEHKLPDNCIVIAAGNRVTDKSVAFKMPKALANRLLHIEIEGSFESWLDWAIRTGINPKVTGFLSCRTDRLFGFKADSDDLAFATPRSWEMVSTILNTVSDDVDKVYQLVAGLIGCGTAIEFRAWTRIYADLPSMEDVFNGRPAKVPETTDGMYAMICSMAAYAKDHKTDAVRLGHSIAYAGKLPADFSTLLMEQYKAFVPDGEEFLWSIPEYVEYAAKKGVMRNGEI